MKIMKSIKWLIGLVAIVAVVSGCQLIEDNAETVETVVEKAEEYAPLADPVTGGMASPIAGILGTIAMGVVSVNRGILAMKRAKAIKEIHGKEGTPSAVAQVDTVASKKVIEKIVGKV